MVVVTGGGAGIGRAIAAGLRAFGADVAALADTDHPALLAQIVPMSRPATSMTSPVPRCSSPRRTADYITGQTLHVDGGTEASSSWYQHPDTGDYTYGPPD